MFCILLITSSECLGASEYFTEWFQDDDNDLAFHTLTLTPDGSPDFYSATKEAATGFPTNPNGGTALTLADDSFVQVAVSAGKQVMLYGLSYSTIYVGSNGYITFDGGDASQFESGFNHFSQPRISGLYDDLDPDAGGTVTYKQFGDRLVVTYMNVPEFNLVNQNSFQIEMFFDGRIRITWLGLGTSDGLAGISQGQGVPFGYYNSNLTGNSLRVSFNPGVFVPGASWRVAGTTEWKASEVVVQDVPPGIHSIESRPLFGWHTPSPLLFQITSDDRVELNVEFIPIASSRIESITLNPPLQFCGYGTLATVEYSPDGRLLATAGGIGVLLRDAETGDVIRILSSANEPGANSLAFSPDGTRLLTGENARTARIWDIQTGEILKTFDSSEPVGGPFDPSSNLGNSSPAPLLDPLPPPVNAVAYSPDGTKAFISDTARVQVWDIQTVQKLYTFAETGDFILAIAVSADGTRVVTSSHNFGGNSQVRLWDAVTGAFIQTLEAGPTLVPVVLPLAFSPDGTTIFMGGPVPRMLDVQTGNLVRSFIGHEQTVNAVALSPDGQQLLTGSRDGTVRLWNIQTGAVQRIFADTNQINSVTFSPNGAKVCAGSRSGNATIWDASTGDLLERIGGHLGGITDLGFTADGSKVMTASDTDLSVKLWDARTGNQLQSVTASFVDLLFNPNSSQEVGALSPDGRIILTGGDSQGGVAELWDARTGLLLRNLYDDPISPATRLAAFSPDSTKILLIHDGLVPLVLYSIETGTVLQRYAVGGVLSVAFSPDGNSLLLGCDDGTAKIVNVQSSQLEQTFTPQAFFPDLIEFFAVGVLSVAFSPDGSKVLTGNIDGTATIWDKQSGAELLLLPYGGEGVRSAVFAPDGKKIIIGHNGGNGMVQVCDLNSHVETVYKNYGSNVSSVAFSPDGKGILIGGAKGVAYHVELNPPQALIIAGGGEFDGNAIQGQTDELAAQTYNMLRKRGYEAKDILYLSAFGERDADGDGINDVDGPATLENVRAALGTGSEE